MWQSSALQYNYDLFKITSEIINGIKKVNVLLFEDASKVTMTATVTGKSEISQTPKKEIKVSSELNKIRILIIYRKREDGIMKNVLYGDGIHDDLPAIQEMLDCQAYVYLPAPKKNYLINGAIKLNSNQELKLDRYTRIMLGDYSNCCMLENKDMDSGNKNIKISGGIWDMNHRNQRPNPGHFADKEKGESLLWEWLSDPQNFDANGKQPIKVYTGICMYFFNIKGFTISDITIENPIIYGLDLSFVEDFTIENINFDYFEGSPKLWNMDGIHIEGGCKNGYIHNLYGACHDDTVAITSDDMVYGDIENITVDGIYGQNSHSAVRLLSRSHKVKNIHITNVYGTYYVYGVIISKYTKAKEYRSEFSNITIDNFYASLCEGTVDVKGNECALIHFGDDIDVENVVIEKLFRDETHINLPTIHLGNDCNINCLSISDCFQTNATDKPIAFIENKGIIDKLYLKNIKQDEELMNGSGTVNNTYICEGTK
ncbi:MAG: hypothetical protein SPH44_05505 [Eubacteriales bacterium]|nr:hypothetical protein [Eubacteriales bacterium]